MTFKKCICSLIIAFTIFVATSISICQELIFSEDFEGAWPGEWSVGDRDDRNGRDYWGDSQVAHHGGNWCGWCADEGDQENNYDDRMHAFMTRRVDLRGFESCWLLYDIWHETEEDYDWFRIYIKPANDDEWDFLSDRYTGDSEGWLANRRVDIPEDFVDAIVDIEFIFHSDESVHNYWGVVLDDIRLYGDEEEGEPDIDADPNVLDYGNVDVEEEASGLTYIRNVGNAVLEVRSVRLDNENDFRINNNPVNFNLDPNQRRGINVYFRPQRAGQIESRLRMETNDPDEDPFTVRLIGTGIGGGLPDLVADRATIGWMNDDEIVELDDFEDIRIDEHQRWAVCLHYRNTGEVPASPVNFYTEVPEAEWDRYSNDYNVPADYSSRFSLINFQNDHVIFSPGHHTIGWYIDPGHRVDESNENNNLRTLQYSVFGGGHQGIDLAAGDAYVAILDNDGIFQRIPDEDIPELWDNEIDSLYFMLEYSNQGNQDANNWALQAEISDRGGVVYSAETDEDWDRLAGTNARAWWGPFNITVNGGSARLWWGDNRGRGEYFNPHSIEWTLDYSDVLDETNEGNNQSSFRWSSTNDVKEQPMNVIEDFELLVVYPNPFNAVTNISYTLPIPSLISLKVYDVSGRLIDSIIEGNQQIGYHTAVWNAKSSEAGIYFIKLEAEEFRAIKKVVLVK
ncbi:T9SS type A sorting domain-containing protein [bacterium]|nr:T9SS type A sorting domain-containing protein [bacterium]